MLSIRDYCVRTLRSTDVWQADADGHFLEPQTALEVEEIRSWVHSLSDGEVLRVRGRDFQRSEDSQQVTGYTSWEFGVAIKIQRRLFLLWEAVVESYLVDGCDFMVLLQIQCTNQSSIHGNEAMPRAIKVILNHGFSPDYGPQYALVCTLVVFLRAKGFEVIVPDFRSR